MNIIKKAFKEWYADVKSQEPVSLSWHLLLEVPIIVYVAVIVIMASIV